MNEEPLPGGNASADVVRLGGTVRKPWSEGSAGVLEYMRILRERGIDLPEPRGQDAQGRMVTEFVPGTPATDAPPLTHAELARVGAMVRQIHDTSEGLDADALGLAPALIPVAGARLVCHGDLTPWNLIVGERWLFVDWDGAAASTRPWDLAYSAQAFTLNNAAADPQLAAEALRAFVDGYGADSDLRAGLAEALPERTWAMYELLRVSHRDGVEPWGSMFVEGHGEHWRSVAQFVERDMSLWAETLGVTE